MALPNLAPPSVRLRHVSPDPVMEQLVQRVTSIESLVTGMSTQMPCLLERLESLREIVAGRHKAQFTTAEVAELTGRSEYTVRRWITEGKLHAIRISEGGPRGRLLVPRDELNKLVATGMGSQIPAATLDARNHREGT